MFNCLTAWFPKICLKQLVKQFVVKKNKTEWFDAAAFCVAGVALPGSPGSILNFRQTPQHSAPPPGAIPLHTLGF